MKIRFFLFVIALITLVFLPACGGVLSIELDVTPTPTAGSANPQVTTNPFIGTPPPQATLLYTPVMPPSAVLDPSADSETIRLAMLDSHEKWQAIYVDGLIMNQLSNGEMQIQHVQMWVDRATARFRVLSGPNEGAPDSAQISDGVTQVRINLTDASVQSQPLQASAHDLNWRAPTAITDTIESHPLDLEIDSRVAELVFPAALAERGGVYNAEGVETIAGRTALVVGWYLNNVMRDRFWIDVETGMLLRDDNYGKESSGSTPNSSVVLRQVVYEAPMPESLFVQELAEKPQFVSEAGEPISPTVPPAAAYDPAAGALYFIIDRTPDTLALAWLPGSCITGREACPAPQEVQGFPNRSSSIHPLIWAPDKKHAALVTDGVVYVYTPENGGWNAVAQFPVIVGEPAWSPDSTWLVFAMLNENVQNLYAVRADGTDLHNLTHGQLTSEGNFWIDGWLADGNLLLSVTNAENVSVQYVVQGVHLDQPVLRQLSGLGSQHGVFTVSADGRVIAFSSQDDASVRLMIAEYTDAHRLKAAPKQIASFQQASLQLMLYVPEAVDRPEDQTLVFTVMGGSSQQTSGTTVYAIRADGTGMRLLFQADEIQRMSFSGDGKSLIVVGTQNGRLTVIPLEGGAARVVEAPGLRLDQRILGASWR